MFKNPGKTSLFYSYNLTSQYNLQIIKETMGCLRHFTVKDFPISNLSVIQGDKTLFTTEYMTEYKNNTNSRGYKYRDVTVEPEDTSIIQVNNTSFSNGIPEFYFTGLKPGKTRVKFTFYYFDEALKFDWINNSSVETQCNGWTQFVQYVDIEVKEKTSYEIQYNYFLNGEQIAVIHTPVKNVAVGSTIKKSEINTSSYNKYKVDGKEYTFTTVEYPKDSITLVSNPEENIFVVNLIRDDRYDVYWYDGEDLIKNEKVLDINSIEELYPKIEEKENYMFNGWGEPEIKDNGDGRIKTVIIKAKWVSKVLENVKLNLSVVCTTKETDNFVIENIDYDVAGEPEKGEANYKYIVKLSETENDLLEIINSKLENYHILDITKENKKELILTYNEETNEWFTEDTFIIYICDGYIVSFDTNGADEDSIDNQYIPEGKSASEPKKLTKRGHTFVKWVDADGNTYTFKDEVKSDIVLKAVWSINKYKVKVKYVDKNGVEIRESYNSEVEYNSDYSIESPSISGYSLSNQEQSIIKGKMDIEDIEVIVIYIKSSSGSSSKPPYIVLPPVKEEEIKEEDIPLDNLPETINYHKAYIFGYPNGNVGPYDWTTRGEVAQMIYNLMDEDFRSRYYTLENNFKDVEKGSWYNAAISTVNAAKIAMGYGNGLFGADDRITRGDLAVMLTRFFKNGEVENSVSINDLQDTYAKEAIEKVVSYGWMGLDDTGNFRQNDCIIRGDCITIINGILGRYTKKEHMYDGMKEWPDNILGDKYYEAIQEATNSHNCEQIDGLEIWLK